MTNKEKLAQIFPDGIEWSKDWLDSTYYESTSEIPNKWIPVSERLPEECCAVLVWCSERKNIYCACYENKQWWIFGAYFQKVEFEVVAWMPLPEPYKAESEDTE